MGTSLATQLGYELGRLETRRFPDGEVYLRLVTVPKDRSVAIVCTLDHPDDKLMPLVFAAATARELGAERIGLIAPYLAYMRQDRRFKPGEAITSRQVAKLLDTFDWLITVDPHLHRYASLGEIYTIPTRVVHAAHLISEWVRFNVSDPLIIGPDSESEQWVAEVANDAEAPYSVLMKTRRGDRDVEIHLKDIDNWHGHTPVLVDDIISSGRTMIEAVRLLTTRGWPPSICIAVHGLFADQSDKLLAMAGARIVTSNTVTHPTNGIDIGVLLSDAVHQMDAAHS